MGRADAHPRPGERRRVGRAGDTEVDDARAVLGEQHVGGLEVAVHDPGAVHGLERLGHPGQQAPDGVLGHRAVRRHRLRERRAGDVRGGHPGPRPLHLRVDDGRGVQALHPLRRGDLLLETAAELGVVGELRPDDLDRQLAAALRAGQVDAPHAPRAQPGHHPIPADLSGVLRLKGSEGRVGGRHMSSLAGTRRPGRRACRVLRPATPGDLTRPALVGNLARTRAAIPRTDARALGHLCGPSTGGDLAGRAVVPTVSVSRRESSWPRRWSRRVIEEGHRRTDQGEEPLPGEGHRGRADGADE